MIPISMVNVTLPEDDIINIDNLRFYRGEIALRSTEECETIDVIHKYWRGNYKLLETHHGYIQWLFPLRELGTSLESQPLTKFEAETFKSSEILLERIIDSYELMLDFFGMILVDRKTGLLKRGQNYLERYQNLQEMEHNYLRISRILKFLGVVGLEYLKVTFLEFAIIEILQNKCISNAVNSLIFFWIPTVVNEVDLERLETQVFDVTGKKLDRKKLVFEDESWSYHFVRKPVLEEDLVKRKLAGKKLALEMAQMLKKKKKVENFLTRNVDQKKIYDNLFVSRKILLESIDDVESHLEMVVINSGGDVSTLIPENPPVFIDKITNETVYSVIFNPCDIAWVKKFQLVDSKSHILSSSYPAEKYLLLDEKLISNDNLVRSSVFNMFRMATIEGMVEGLPIYIKVTHPNELLQIEIAHKLSIPIHCEVELQRRYLEGLN